MRLTVLAVLLVVSVPGGAQEALNLAREMPPAGKVSVAEAVRGGVDYLIQTQNRDGSFGRSTVGRTWEIMASVPGSHHAFRAATTALCWMGLRDVDYQTEESRAAARRALAWMVEHVRVKRATPVEMYNIWALGYGLRALAQAIRTGAEGASEADLRAEARQLVRALQIYQVPDGGFGYYDFEAHTFHPSGTGMSFTTATVLVALHEARAAGIEVPDRLIERAVKSVRACRKKDGSYIYGGYLRYRPRMGVNQPKGSSLRTQACNVALRLFDGGVTEQDLRDGLHEFEACHRFAVAGVRRPIPHESWYQVSGYFYLYGHMYAAMVLERLGPADRERFWPVVVRGLLKCREPDGSFWDYPIYGYGKAYGTGYALMTLGRCPGSIARTLGPGGTPPADTEGGASAATAKELKG